MREKSGPRGGHPKILEESVGFFLGRAHEALLHSIGTQLSELGLPPGRIAIITLIDENPGITPRRLTELTRRDKSTLTPMLSDLEKCGYLTRTPSEKDRRSYGLSLTEAGVEIAGALRKIVESNEQKIASLLGSGDRQALLTALKALSAGLYKR